MKLKVKWSLGSAGELAEAMAGIPKKKKKARNPSSIEDEVIKALSASMAKTIDEEALKSLLGEDWAIMQEQERLRKRFSRKQKILDELTEGDYSRERAIKRLERKQKHEQLLEAGV